jgi:MFS superfamily sulfate permease-like transporter
MNIGSINELNDKAILVMSATAITVTQINLIVGIFTAIAGLAIQLYFKVEQNKREKERHEWERKNNKKF